MQEKHVVNVLISKTNLTPNVEYDFQTTVDQLKESIISSIKRTDPRFLPKGVIPGDCVLVDFGNKLDDGDALVFPILLKNQDFRTTVFFFSSDLMEARLKKMILMQPSEAWDLWFLSLARL